MILVLGVGLYAGHWLTDAGLWRSPRYHEVPADVEYESIQFFDRKASGVRGTLEKGAPYAVRMLKGGAVYIDVHLVVKRGSLPGTR